MGLDAAAASVSGLPAQGPPSTFHHSSRQPILPHGKLGAGQIPWATQAELGPAEHLAAVSAAFAFLLQAQRSHGVANGGGGGGLINPTPAGALNLLAGSTAATFPGAYAADNLLAQPSAQPQWPETRLARIGHEMYQPHQHLPLQQHMSQESWLRRMQAEALQQLHSHVGMVPGLQTDLSPLLQRGPAHVYGSPAQPQQHGSLGSPHQLQQQIQQSLLRRLEHMHFQTPHQGQSLSQQILQASLSQLEGQHQPQQQQMPLGQADFVPWPMVAPPGLGQFTHFPPAHPLLAHAAAVTVASLSQMAPPKIAAELNSGSASAVPTSSAATPSQGSIGGASLGGNSILASDGVGAAHHAASAARHNVARGKKRTLTRIVNLGSHAAELDTQVELIKGRAHPLPDGKFP
jgi:hypothetical protein